MVHSQKIILLSFFLAHVFTITLDGVSHSAASQKTTAESFVEQEPVGRPKRQSLSKARRQAVETLESMAHELTAQTALAAQALDDILWNIRDIAESNDDSAFMSTFLKERDKTLASLKQAEKDIQERTNSLRTLNKVLKPNKFPQTPKNQK